MTSFNEMKGLKELTAVVNNFTQQFDCVAEISDTFWVDVATNTVYFSLFYEKREEEEFMSTVYRCNPKVEMNIFLWSLLHEIFHVETYDDLTEEELLYCVDVKENIQRGLVNPLEYYDLPIERMATEAAVKWANTHINELAEFWTQFLDATMRFYQLNGIV